MVRWESFGKITYVRSSANTHHLRPMLQRVQLRRDYPSQGAPGRGEEGDEETDESNRSPLAGHVEHGDGARVSLARGGGAECSNDKVADAHAHATPQEQRAATELIEDEHGGNRRENVDHGQDHANQEGAGNAGVFEELGAVVEDEVDA